jgi:hypothetical protein
MHYFLGLEIWQQKGEAFLGQGKYTLEILKRFGMEDCKPMATPMITNLKKLNSFESKKVSPTIYRQLIRCLMYLTNTRPDICFSVNTLSQHMVDPKRVHWIAKKHILRYLKGTIEYMLQCLQGDQVKLVGYSDSDWAGSTTNRKSTSGCCFSLGLGMISWYNKKQKLVALSSAEVEYMGASQASCEAIWSSKKEHKPEDESKNSTEEYKDAERRNDSRIFLQNLRIQRKVRSDWRYHRRRRTHNDGPKWSHKTLGCIHPNDMCQNRETKV